MIINRREIARNKVEKLKTGFSAFSESLEVTDLMKKYIKEQNLHVYVDETPLGSWFIPEKQERN
ncbi:hypothetical protein [Aneurinibacillus terranovensis]|uniref:hypothetical protein n=1 Tax=Aneurinibacillus terranovensis TaxID=278991 RepID=UPI000422D8D2|nr:hypothetical protein [Aneurinibacillus terranovensis]